MSSSETPEPGPALIPASAPPPDSGPPSPPPPPTTGARPPRRRRWRRGSLLLLFILVGAGGLWYWWRQSRVTVYTDNAYVVGNITPISSEISGQVVALFIDDNMIVQPGDPLAQIDPVSFQIQVDQALSDYKQATSEAEAAAVTARYTDQDRKSLLEGARAKQDEAEQAVEAAQVTVQTRTRLHEKDEELLASLQAQLPGLIALRDNARDYYDRFKSLASTGDIPVQDKDNREAAYRDAAAKLDSLRSKIAAADRQVLASKSQLQEAGFRLEQARKALANTVALVGRAEAEQLQPQVATNTATALRNKQMLAEAGCGWPSLT